MSVVEFTPRAAQNVLGLLGQEDHTTENALLVDMHQSQAEISIRRSDEVLELQRDLDVMGPFRVPIGELELPLFVRDREPGRGGCIELDSLACGGPCDFQVRGRQQD